MHLQKWPNLSRADGTNSPSLRSYDQNNCEDGTVNLIRRAISIKDEHIEQSQNFFRGDEAQHLGLNLSFNVEPPQR
jgi:hypothetical protein